eukprot:GHVT01024452.1.p1 GENE.GHVT01024452.1~~GHVT01024452.1.p1  ORF type:complete len:167 (-),score=24.06 GHVT01024452.1:236-736(-)
MAFAKAATFLVLALGLIQWAQAADAASGGNGNPLAQANPNSTPPPAAGGAAPPVAGKSYPKKYFRWHSKNFFVWFLVIFSAWLPRQFTRAVYVCAASTSALGFDPPPFQPSIAKSSQSHWRCFGASSDFERRRPIYEASGIASNIGRRLVIETPGFASRVPLLLFQ